MPAVNWVLLAGVVAAVVGFGSSSALAGAYGIAVTVTMLITTLLTYFVVRARWRLPRALALGATAFFLPLDALLVVGCAVKFFDGGWFPLALGRAAVRGDDDLAARAARTLLQSIQQRRTPSCSPSSTRCRPAGDLPRARAPPSTRSPIPTPCRRRCCTTSSTTRCCTSAT